MVTRKAAYFTDSQQPVIYRVTRSKHGAPGEVSTIPLSGDYQHLAGQFNLNGIVATANGKTLIAVQSAAKKLFLINPASGVTRAIDTGTYDLANGDGLLLEGKTLYVVQNRSNQIAVFRLSKDLTKATFVKAADGSRLRRPDDDGPGGQAPLRGQRALRHRDAGRPALRHRQGRLNGRAPHRQEQKNPRNAGVFRCHGGGGNRTRVHGRDRKGFSKLSLRSCLAASHHAGRCSAGQSVVGVPCGRHGPPGHRASLLLKDSLRGGPEGPPVT